ncbi:(d)CMP kinase [Melissococcus plutonius]|uniref:Cytidylate kinase n=2 Tax=Melissococcus plutonius TaxID=33970 RepID=F3YAI7_MELPT|nr:(d)CMP kinase [Melissococcus plutonius]BAL62126.1 cytidylate kinase [Melissococcus plutonius DAT561]AIM24980.1 cytidylate kinase Cmk [Melissococcus plutonius S1]KMT25140.1 cytidylate kinase Cmk [Melissococcus plutonius]KMT26777.1 cytidylate kinase Cmk [Melissococcus plutonius]KMT28027.1 cytidylate kinase Cmk [Melissococcus plutonius]
MKKISIAIDGPASSGKSTISKILAEKLQYIYCDTGAMYRALTYLAIQYHVDKENEEDLVNLLDTHTISFQFVEKRQKVFLDKQEVTQKLRQPDVTNLVSYVAKHKKVRDKMVNLQREIAATSGVIMDGRDIGTAVLPNAEVKIFLVASVQKRAERRYRENKKKGIFTNFKQLKKEIEQRDFMDSHREFSPLVQAKDAICIDTTGKNIKEVVTIIEKIIYKKIQSND